MSASAPWWKPSAGPLSPGSTDGWRPTSISAPPTTRRPTRSRHGCAQRPEVQAILPGGRAETQIGGAPVEILGLPDHATYRDHWPLLQSAANAWDELRPGDAGFVSEQLARRLNLAIGDRIEVPAPGGNWPLEIVGIYADYGNPEGPARRQCRGADRGTFPAMPQTRMALRVAPAQNPGADLGAAGKIRPRRPQPAGSGDAEGRIDAHLQPHLCGDRGAECLHARRRRHRAADQPADAAQFAPAAARAAMGDRHHAAAARGDRADEDACRWR